MWHAVQRLVGSPSARRAAVIDTEMRWIACALVSMVGWGCSSDLGPLPERVNCFGASPGEACETDGQWCASGNQCGVDVSYCKCTDGAYACTDPYTAAEIATCTVVVEASCLVEGTGVCDREPAGGGSCSCGAGTWACTNGCDGCPQTAPTDGDACATSHDCRYMGPPAVTCTCAGTFTCRPS